MAAVVHVESVLPRKLAAVRRELSPGGVASAWRPALDKVWAFLRTQPGLWTTGHNVFLYHHSSQGGATLLCDFGVEVTRHFEPAGEVYPTETPAGQAVVATHRGPYDRLRTTHEAIQTWISENGRQSSGVSWEVYGDPTPNPADTETLVAYLLQ